MHYIVDGYNLLFQLGGDDDDLQSAREELLDDLVDKISLLNLSVTIAFDSSTQPGLGTRSHRGQLEILFTSAGESADDLIIDLLNSSANANNITVVTSDKPLAWRARRLGAKTESARAFIQWLNARYRKQLSRPREQAKQSQRKPPEAPPQPAPTQNRAKEGPQTIQRPSPSTPVTQCTEYYRVVFEERLEKLSRKKKETHRKKKK